MTGPRALGATFVLAGIVAGTAIDRVPPGAPRQRDGYYLLAADLHVHTFFGDGALAPWEVAREARRRGLDAIVITNHNQLIGARLGALVARIAGTDTIVIRGQEVTAPRFHMIAAGISEPVDWRLSAREAAAAVHRQGGVAIAAHPVRYSWRSTDEGALRELDGSEAAHPLALRSPSEGAELAAFFRAASAVNPSLAAIGSSDFHAGGQLGRCRTYVFATEASERGVLEAIRDARTVAEDGHGVLIGPPPLVSAVRETLAADPPAPQLERGPKAASWLTLAGLLVLLLFW